MVGRPSRRFGSGRETLPEDQMWSGALPEVRTWSGDLPGGPELVGRPSSRSRTARETFSEVRNWSGDYLEGPKLLRRPSQKSGSG